MCVCVCVCTDWGHPLHCTVYNRIVSLCVVASLIRYGCLAKKSGEECALRNSACGMGLIFNGVLLFSRSVKWRFLWFFSLWVFAGVKVHLMLMSARFVSCQIREYDSEKWIEQRGFYYFSANIIMRMEENYFTKIYFTNYFDFLSFLWFWTVFARSSLLHNFKTFFLTRLQWTLFYP